MCRLSCNSGDGCWIDLGWSVGWIGLNRQMLAFCESMKACYHPHPPIHSHRSGHPSLMIRQSATGVFVRWWLLKSRVACCCCSSAMRLLCWWRMKTSGARPNCMQWLADGRLSSNVPHQSRSGREGMLFRISRSDWIRKTYCNACKAVACDRLFLNFFRIERARPRPADNMTLSNSDMECRRNDMRERADTKERVPGLI